MKTRSNVKTETVEVKGAPENIEWTVMVTEPLPNCPSIEAAWNKIAAQTKWSEWRSESKMRGNDVSTILVPPATEPLKTGDEYIVKIGAFMKIRCRVIASTAPGATDNKNGEMVFDASGRAIGGLVNARFRFTIFMGEDGVVMARAQEKIMSLPFFVPPKETLESEHRHTFKDLNASFL